MRFALRWLLPIASWSLGCVTYRDRIVVVTQHIEVNQTASTQAAPVDASVAAPGDSALLPATPGRLDPAAMRATLDGFGSWVDAPAYGSVWIPDERVRGQDFVPYLSGGQWLPTRAGWYWQSDFAWGAIPFHYGRWVMVGGLWAWVPGSAFAPAWVDWRVGNGWVAWAPLAPGGAAFSASHMYCAWGRLRGPGLRARTVLGPAASSLYAYTAAVPVSCAQGASCYSPGPPVPTAVATDVSVPWATARATAREGALPSTQGIVISPVGTPVEAPARIPDVPGVQRVLNVATGTLRPADALPAHPVPPSVAEGGPSADVEPSSGAADRGTRLVITSAEAPVVRPTATSITAGSSGYSVIPARRMTWSSSLPAVTPEVAPRPMISQRFDVQERVVMPPTAPVATPPPIGAPMFAPRAPSEWRATSGYGSPVFNGYVAPMPSLSTTPSAAVAGDFGRPVFAPSPPPPSTVFVAPSAPVYAAPTRPAYTAPPITQAPVYVPSARGSPFGMRAPTTFAPGVSLRNH